MPLLASSTPSRAVSPDPCIGPFLQNPRTEEMTIVWVRSDDAPCSLFYGTEDGSPLARRITPRQRIDNTSHYLYEARLIGLRPGTHYAYRLECPRGTRSSHFRTFPQVAQRLRFIAYGDNKNGHVIHRQLAARFDHHAPLFLLHTGDLTNHGQYEEYQPFFFDPLRGVIDHIPILPARGNHEGDGQAYRQLFSLPSGDTWYAIECANVHVAVLDTTGWRHPNERHDIHRMYTWLERDLAHCSALWKIVVHHEPSYDLGWRKDDWGLSDFLPLMRRMKVDLTLSGHAHGYQRLHPMFARGFNENHPITHIVTAGAGASIGRRPLDPSPYCAADARRFHYMAITVEGERLTAEVLSEKDERLDAFELHKPHGHYGAAFLRRAMPAEHYPRGPF